MASALAPAAPLLARSPSAARKLAPSRAPPARTAVLTRARHGPRRRWWSESWEADDAGAEGWGLDGPLAPGSSDAPIFVDQITTFFCSDGSVVQLGATPHLLQQLERRGAQRRSEGDTLPLPGEQGLCIGSVFRISATNGIEPSRRVNLAGFCFSTEQLYERVEDTVLARGGEVFETQRLLKSGVHEALVMTVAIPLLWGVPPEYERLKAGIKTGGGIIDKIERQWVIY